MRGHDEGVIGQESASEDEEGEEKGFHRLVQVQEGRWIS